MDSSTQLVQTVVTVKIFKKQLGVQALDIYKGYVMIYLNPRHSLR